MKRGKWIHSVRFSEVHTAKAWGMSPSEFGALSSFDRAEMIVHDQEWDKMLQYESEQAEKKAIQDRLIRETQKGKSGGI